MNLINPAQWAQNEFGFAQLGDRRRNKRLVNIAEHLAANPGGDPATGLCGLGRTQSGVSFEALDCGPGGGGRPSVERQTAGAKPSAIL